MDRKGLVVTDLIKAVQQKADILRVTVITRSFQLEGEMHCPRIGKGARLLTNLLNSAERRFLVLTNVTIINRATGQLDPKVCPMLEVNVESIELVRPEFAQDDVVE